MIKSRLKKIDRNTAIIIIAVIAIIVTGALIYASKNKNLSWSGIFGLSQKQVGERAIKYINENQLSNTPVELVSTSVESGLVKIKIKIGSREVDSYATKDGKYLFPTAFDMTPAENEKGAANNNNKGNQPTEVTKNDNPVLEAYVVSRCPYGLQMQRAMAEAVKNMPSLGQYMKVRYIGTISGNTITAMHGEAEAKENLRQICIRQEQANKYWDYVGCQMKASGTEKSCESLTGIDSAKLNACISDVSRGVAYAKEDFDLSDGYGVQGSPTMVLNGTTISESNYGGRSADGIRGMICAGFNNEQSFCSTKLNSSEAAVSFSAAYAGSGSANSADANCGS